MGKNYPKWAKSHLKMNFPKKKYMSNLMSEIISYRF